MANLERQENFKNYLRQEPLRSSLLEYADERGITGDSFVFNSVQEREDFKLAEVHGRVVARKVFKDLGEYYRDNGYESTIDGMFTSGGTYHPVEIKGTHYDIADDYVWFIDPEKYEELVKQHGYLLRYFIDRDDPFEIDWLLFSTETPVREVVTTCKKSVCNKRAGTKTKKFIGWKTHDAVFRGHISGRKTH